MSDLNPKTDIYEADGKRIQVRAFKVSLAALVGTAAAVLFLLTDVRTYSQVFILSLAAAWAIGAPSWFFYEYFYVYRKHAAPGSWELFKHGQQVGIAIWAGLTATLYALGTSDIVKPDVPRYECKALDSSPPASAAAVTSLVLSCRPAC